PPALGCSSWTISATCSLTSQISSRSPFTAVSTLPSRSGNPGRPGTPGLGASPNQSSKKCPILRATRNNARSARHRVTSAAATAPAPTIHSPRAVASGGCISLSNIHFGDSPLCGMSLLYNQYASLASRWPAHEDMLISRGPGSTKAPGGYRGCARGLLLPRYRARCASRSRSSLRYRWDRFRHVWVRVDTARSCSAAYSASVTPLGGGGVGQGQTAGELGEVGFPVRVGRFAASAGAGADRAREVLAALVSAQDAWRRGRPPPRPHLLSQAGVTPPRLGGPHPRTARTSPPAATPTARGTPPAWSPPQRTIPGHPRGGHGRPGTGSGRSAARTAAPPPPVPPDPRESAPTPPADGTPR